MGKTAGHAGWIGVAVVLLHTQGLAAGIPSSNLEEVVVTAQRVGLVGSAGAASEGIVTRVQLEGRPVLRPGEVFEVVPGLIVTQHRGKAKANQYFLRGFNLDHGTDFARSTAGRAATRTGGARSPTRWATSST